MKTNTMIQKQNTNCIKMLLCQPKGKESLGLTNYIDIATLPDPNTCVSVPHEAPNDRLSGPLNPDIKESKQ